MDERSPYQSQALTSAPVDSEISWFHGPLSREEAENLLRSEGTDGCFLVRESTTSTGDYVLTLFYAGEIYHYQLLRHGEDAFFSIDKEKIFHGLETLIEYHQEENSGLETKLTKFCSKEPPPHDTRRHGRTNLLHRATREGNYTVVSELLKSRHRSLEAKNQDGQTAVHLACRSGFDDILLKLIDCDANVNCRDTAGNTPLHYACQYNNVSTARILVINGKANVQARNAETGWVPLHEASSRGHSELVQVLLSLDAPVRPRTPKGETPAQLAQYFPTCLKVLQEYCAPEPILKKDQWYHGTLDRREAIELLHQHGNSDGIFLVRYSDKHGGMNVLTMIAAGQTYHFHIKSKENYYFIDDGPLFESMEHVIDYYSRIQDGLPSVLTTPILPRPKPPVPELPRHGLSATMPLKKKQLKLPREGNGSSTMGRRGSAPHPIVPLPPLPGCISLSKIELGSILGEGEFGAVYKGTYEADDNKTVEVAVKTLRDEHVPINRTEFLREAKVMTSLNHHCVVKLIGLFEGPPLMMVQELVRLGSMLAYLLEFPDRIQPSYELKLWASQIACGMKYLEAQKFVHRDLAARNILLSTRHQAKISDFGLSRVVSGEYYRATAGGRWPIKWYAPESYNFGTFSHASDVWSYGVTLWEMFSFGEQPYGDMKGAEVIKQVEAGERLEKPEKCPNDVYEVMMSCWSYTPADRPTFTALLDTFSRDPEYINIRQLVLGDDIS